MNDVSPVPAANPAADPALFAAALAEYLERAKAIRRAEYDRLGYKYGPGELFEFDIQAEKPGARYIRVVNLEARGGPLKRASVYSFIEVATGDVFKPASFKKPAKHARGNIFTAEAGTESHSAYGPAYLR